jgi:signal transduction histidine kinase
MTAVLRRPPWSPRTWRQVLYLAAGVPAQLLPVAVVLACDPWVEWQSHPISVFHDHVFPLAWPSRYGPYWTLWVVGLVIVFLAMPWLTLLERNRVLGTTGTLIARQPRRRGIVAAVRSAATWRQLRYHLLAGPALAVASIVTLACWLAGLMYTLVYAYAMALPPGNALHRHVAGRLRWEGPFAIPGDAFVTAAGLVLLLAAPWLTAAVAALDASATQAMLGPSRTEELEQRVEELAQTREGAVDAADTERRKLERDLHDGTQQRLVALAMNLGMARTATTVEEAQQAIAEAHEDTKAALTELRNLVRGLHPPVLEDRGLDAALSGIAARMPIPVRLSVDVPRRPPAIIEAVAYFVVTEGLTNITKHAQASQAEVVVQRAGDRLHVIITDDGVGGADPAHGTGLGGLAKRVASVDGTFEISSPAGGPTLLTVDLPCVR